MKQNNNSQTTQKTKTVGEESLKLWEKSQGEEGPDAIELQREIHKGSNSEKSYEEEVWEAVDRGKRDSEVEGDFYIVVLFKKERHLTNIMRQMFFYRQSCPTPQYDQTVYKYHRDDDELEFLWVVPNNSACVFFPRIGDALPPDQRWLLSFVEKFNNGELDKLSQKLNKEPKNFLR